MKLLFFLSSVVAITILDRVIVTIQADFIEIHTPYSSNFSLNSTAFTPIMLKNIYGFSSDNVLIFTSWYFNRFSLNFLFIFSYSYFLEKFVKASSKALFKAATCPTIGVPLLYIVVLEPPFINVSNTTSSFLQFYLIYV